MTVKELSNHLKLIDEDYIVKIERVKFGESFPDDIIEVRKK